VADSLADIADRLIQLGFSQYEARTYVGLLTLGEATGYALSNETGVPGPKVYETLRRLAERKAAVQTRHRPACYVAVTPDRLLAGLEADFRERLAAARTELEALPRRGAPEQPLAVRKLDRFPSAVQHATEAIGRARTRVYLSGRAAELKPLAEAVANGSQHGVEFVIVHFGALPFPRPLGRAFRHASTQGSLSASRKGRHLVLVADSRAALWAIARDGKSWEGLYSEDPTFASAIKAYIRHDIFVQRIYADAPAELEARYGPGLLGLTDFTAESDAEDRADQEAVG